MNKPLNTTRTAGLVISILAVSIGLFHLYTSYGGPLVDFRQRSLHLYGLLTMAFLIYPSRALYKGSGFFDVLLSIASAGIGIYMFTVYDRIAIEGGA